MSLDLAVSPSTRTPAVYLKVNLLAGQNSPGTGQLKVLVLAPKGAGGTITDNTELLEAVGSTDTVATKFFKGSMAHLVAKILFTEVGADLNLDMMSPAPVGGAVAATLDITFAGTVTIAYTLNMFIAGRLVQASWNPGVLASAFATAVRDAINLLTNDLPITASAVGAVLTLTAKSGGTWGNDIVVYATLSGGAGGTINGGASINTKVGTTIAGTTTADVATCLAAVSTREYAYILACDGNTVVATSGATTAYGKIDAHILQYSTGAHAKLQQQILGYTGIPATANTAAGYRNVGTSQLMFYQAAQSLPCEVAAAELGQRLRERLLDPAANRIGLQYRATLYGPVDTVNDKLTDVELESALNNGVSPVDFLGNGRAFGVMPITTYAFDAQSNPDARLLDTSRIDGSYFCARDLATFLAQEYPQKKIIDDLIAGQELPRGCVQIQTIRTSAYARARFWVSIGVVQSVALEAAIANGTFVVQRDTQDSSQVDMVVPLKIVPPLRKFSAVVNHTGP